MERFGTSSRPRRELRRPMRPGAPRGAGRWRVCNIRRLEAKPAARRGCVAGSAHHMFRTDAAFVDMVGDGSALAPRLCGPGSRLGVALRCPGCRQPWRRDGFRRGGGVEPRLYGAGFVLRRARLRRALFRWVAGEGRRRTQTWRHRVEAPDQSRGCNRRNHSCATRCCSRRVSSSNRMALIRS